MNFMSSVALTAHAGRLPHYTALHTGVTAPHNNDSVLRNIHTQSQAPVYSHMFMAVNIHILCFQSVLLMKMIRFS